VTGSGAGVGEEYGVGAGTTATAVCPWFDAAGEPTATTEVVRVEAAFFTPLGALVGKGKPPGKPVKRVKPVKPGKPNDVGGADLTVDGRP
jgi:hypothetical protein